MLPEIEADERETKCGGPSQDVGQSAFREEGLTGLDERPVAELKRFDEFCRRKIGLHS